MSKYCYFLIIVIINTNNKYLKNNICKCDSQFQLEKNGQIKKKTTIKQILSIYHSTKIKSTYLNCGNWKKKPTPEPVKLAARPMQG